MRTLARYLWASPNTVLGLVLVALGLVSGGRVRCVGGVIEIDGGAVAWLLRHAVPLGGGARALTLGHVVLGRDPGALDATRAHERIHVRQYERWGPLFLPAYGCWSLAIYVRGGDPYRDNPFEREAFEATRGV